MEKKSKLKGWNNFRIENMLRPIPKEVTAMDDYRLLITFDNGEVKAFDASVLLQKKPYKQLIDKSIFKTARPNGLKIEWDGDIDLCPDDVYYGSTSIDS